MATAHPPPIHLLATAGQPQDVLLDATASAGFRWQAAPAPAGCSLQDAGARPAGAGDGGGVQQRFVFHAPQAGLYRLGFELRRGWEADAAAVQVVEVQVR